MSMLMRKRQLAAKIESNEGVVESLSVADANNLVYEPRINFEPAMHERDPARASTSRLSKIPGKRPGTLTFRHALKGSGAATTSPQWAKFLKACGFIESAYYSINIGTITSGPFRHGEMITGGTSDATGRVVIATANGAAAILFVPISGTFESGETITGETSGASATTSSTPTEAGKEYKRETLDETFTNIPTLTMAGYEHGMRKLLKGCRGKVNFAFKSGEPVFLNYEFMGVEAGIADVSMFSNPTYETTKPAAFMNASFSIDAYAARLSELQLEIGNTLSPRDDVNESRGILSYLITDTIVNGSFDPEMVLVAAHDFYGKMHAASEMVLDFVVGSSAGNRFRFYAPRAQYVSIGDEDREGIAIGRAAFDLNGSESPGDDEITILAY